MELAIGMAVVALVVFTLICILLSAGSRSGERHVNEATSTAAIDALPDDLGKLDARELGAHADIRDDAIGRLFRRWPSLSESETRLLERLHAERMRIAKQLGKRLTRHD